MPGAKVVLSYLHVLEEKGLNMCQKGARLCHKALMPCVHSFRRPFFTAELEATSPTATAERTARAPRGRLASRARDGGMNRVTWAR